MGQICVSLTVASAVRVKNDGRLKVKAVQLQMMLRLATRSSLRSAPSSILRPVNRRWLAATSTGTGGSDGINLPPYPYSYAEGPASLIGARLNSERAVDEVDVVIVGGISMK
jgi:hypothetical protein